MLRSTFARLAILTLVVGCGSPSADAQQPKVPEATLPPLRLVEFVRGMRNPVFLTHDGTSRLFIVEQPGTVRLVTDKGVSKPAYLDLSKKVQYGGECGLLSVVFHPDFATNGYLYANYTAKRPKLQTVVSEFRVNPKATRVDPATERAILTIDQPYPNHNGGQLQFGPDGMLYIGMGDGGSAGDPLDAGQDPGNLLGKMLRIDVTPRKGYAVPKDNPFVGDRRFRPEVWAWGLRNPWRFSFDRETGDCLSGDVGQNLYEEIDLIVKGGNYGWNRREAFHPFSGGSQRRGGRGTDEQFIDPLVEYGRELGLSVTGGYVYRGKAFPSLAGLYFYADYGTGRLWGLRLGPDGRAAEHGEFTVTRNGKPILNRLQPAGFGEDVNGELFVCDHNGVVYRIEVDEPVALKSEARKTKSETIPKP